VNPDYSSTFVFVNDYSAVKEEQADYHPPDQDGSLSNLVCVLLDELTNAQVSQTSCSRQRPSWANATS